MSAFICSSDDFKTLAVFAAARGPGRVRVNPMYIRGLHTPLDGCSTAQLASLYADTLYQENIRSVRARYPDDKWSSLPGPGEKPLRLVVSNRDFALAKYRLPAVAILKMLDCLEYQSCETSDWENTLAHELLNAIRRAAIRSLPGYEDTAWDYSAAA